MTKLELLKHEEQHHNNNGQIHDSGRQGIHLSLSANVNIMYMFAVNCIFSTKTILLIDRWNIITHFLIQFSALEEKNMKNLASFM